MILAPIPREDVEAVWPAFKPHIERVVNLRGGGKTVEQIKDECRDGLAVLWGIADKTIVAAFVTELHTLPKGRVCRISYLAGDGMKAWVAHIATVEKWAIAHGCKSVVVTGRPGWWRVLKDYDLKQVTLEKDIA